MTVSSIEQRPRILIAEDNYLTAEDVRVFVQDCGYSVAGPAPSVERGLALIADGVPDGAVLDINLGGEPCFPMAHALHAKGVPFILLSAYGANMPVPAEFDGAPRLAKPFEPVAFRSALHDLVSRWHPQPDLGNAVLDSLPTASRASLAPLLTRVELNQGEVLETPGQPVGHVYFPVSGLVSLFAGSDRGMRIEIASIGRDGMTAPATLLGHMTSRGRAAVQVAGTAWRITVDSLRQRADADAELRRLLLAHIGSALRELADTISYSGRATIVERLARWLLQATQRLGSRQIALTHDALAEILGVRRPSISVALQTLEERRVIRSTRRAIVVLDVDGLAEQARHHVPSS